MVVESPTDMIARLTGFTPGPWNLCAHLRIPNENECPCGYRGVIYGGDSEYAVCQPGHEVTVGQEGTEPPRYPRPTEIANAALIAAAPDLHRELAAALAREASLRDLLNERDGGTHDSDCKALRATGPKLCNCGHDAVVAALEVKP